MIGKMVIRQQRQIRADAGPDPHLFAYSGTTQTILRVNVMVKALQLELESRLSVGLTAELF